MRVLLIDDSPLVLAMCRESLESCGVDVACANSGTEGVELATTFNPDAVLCDLQMPEMNGIDVVRALRAVRPQLPVIIFTEHSELALAVHAMREGSFGYLIKGTPDEVIRRELEVAASHKRLREENQRMAAEIARLQRLQEQADRRASLNIVIGGLAHEINNPLAVLVSNVFWVRRDVLPLVDDLCALSNRLAAASDANAGRLLRELVQTHADLLTTCVDDLNDVLDSSTESNQRIKRIITDLTRLTAPSCSPGWTELSSCRSAVEEGLIAMTGRKPEVTWTAEEGLPPIAMAPSDLTLVISNLLANAVQATHPGSAQISVRAIRSENGAAIEVSDNGCGMTPEQLKRLGTPFFTTKSPVCTGLGFCLVDATVRAIGGRLSVKSTVNSGTIVRLWLPTAAAVQTTAQVGLLQPTVPQAQA